MPQLRIAKSTRSSLQYKIHCLCTCTGFSMSARYFTNFFFAFSKNRTNRGQVSSKKFARSVLSSVYTRLLIAIEAFWNFSRFRTRAYSFIPLFTILFVAATLVFFFLKIGKVEKIISSYFWFPVHLQTTFSFSLLSLRRGFYRRILTEIMHVWLRNELSFFSPWSLRLATVCEIFQKHTIYIEFPSPKLILACVETKEQKKL